MIEHLKPTALDHLDKTGNTELFIGKSLGVLSNKINEIIDHLQGRGDINAQPAQDIVKCGRANCLANSTIGLCEKHFKDLANVRDCGEINIVCYECKRWVVVDGMHCPDCKSYIYNKSPNSDEGNGS